jgi:hypothetical protein
MIDLHIHSDKSDGTDTPLDILEKAQKLNLKYISFTDHETVSAYKDFENIDVSKHYTGKIVNGIELKNYYNGCIIDILGYGIDLKAIQKHLDKYFSKNTHAVLQIKYLKNFYKEAKGLNLKLTPIDELDWNPDKDWASGVFFKELKKYPENESKLPKDLWENDFKYFKKHYTYNKNNLFFNDKSKDYPSPEITVKAIHEAGGKAFIAHTFEYTWIDDKQKFLDDLRENAKIDGVECFYSNFTDSESEFLIDYCKKHNLYMSGGSDYHGNNKPGINVGIGRGKLKVSKSILEWL